MLQDNNHFLAGIKEASPVLDKLVAKVNKFVFYFHCFYILKNKLVSFLLFLSFLPFLLLVLFLSLNRMIQVTRRRRISVKRRTLRGWNHRTNSTHREKRDSQRHGFLQMHPGKQRWLNRFRGCRAGFGLLYVLKDNSQCNIERSIYSKIATILRGL